jgi:alkanesulfonate monooxygenase SsuD/methylene tetrahydromethanopterin reductase-like flavin-dependent oxidoreductase (luciferase family)
MASRHRSGLIDMPDVPLSVLDLVPVMTGRTPGDSLRESIDLAQQSEAFGYSRYWFAEHHLNPGVAGTSPAVVLALIAGATSRIRLGSAAVQMGHRTALSVLEEFGLLDSLHPGRFDLGLGRSGGAPPAPSDRPAATPGWTPNGLRIPARFPLERLLASPRFGMVKSLVQQPQAQQPTYTEQVGTLLALLRGDYRSADGIEAHVVPGEGADIEVWIHGSSGGESARVAGANGLRFGANYHVSPASVLEAVAGYREAFRPSAQLAAPYVIVSADVVVADDDATARRLAAGYGPWVRSIRTGAGAISYPTPDEAAAMSWSDDDEALVADRLETRFVGAPETVVDGLTRLRDATDADELLITTITHDHSDRVRSFELLAKEWWRR